MLDESRRNPKTVQPNTITFSSLIEACADTSHHPKIQSIVNTMSKLGLLDVYLSSDNIVDLHGAPGSFAVGIIDFILSKPWPVSNKDMLIITGKGIHSEGDPVLYKKCNEFVSNKYQQLPDIIRIDQQ